MTDIQENKIDNRLLQLRKALGLSQKQISEMLGLARAYISELETGRKPVAKSTIYAYIDNLNVNRDWLETGEGPMFLDRVATDKAPATVKGTAPYYETVSASAGLSFLVDNGTEQPHEYIKVPGLRVDAFINVFGDSMYPVYESGDIIGIKRIEKDMVHFGHAYVVLMMDGEAYIKYVQPGIDENHWSLDNENAHYRPREFHLSKIKALFKIKSVITKKAL